MLRQALTTSQSSFLPLVLLFPFFFLFLLFLLFLASHQHQYLEPDGLWQPVWSNEHSWLSGPDGCLTDLKMGPEWRRVDREQIDFKGRKKKTTKKATFLLEAASSTGGGRFYALLFCIYRRSGWCTRLNLHQNLFTSRCLPVVFQLM